MQVHSSQEARQEEPHQVAATPQKSHNMRKKRAQGTPGNTSGTKPKNTPFGQPNFKLGKRRRTIIDDDEEPNQNESARKQITPGQQTIQSLFAKAAAPRQAQEEVVVQTPRSSPYKNLSQNRIKSFLQKKESKLDSISLGTNSAAILSNRSPIQKSQKQQLDSPTMMKALLTPQQSVRSRLQPAIKTEEGNIPVLKFESERNLNVKLGGKIVDEQPNIINAEQQKQLATEPSLSIKPKSEKQEENADDQIALQKVEQVKSDTESEDPGDQIEVLQPAGQQLATVQQVITNLEQKWRDEDKRMILTSGVKTFKQWVDILASRFQLGEFESSQNPRSAECIDAILRFCQPNHKPKRLTNYKDYETACQDTFKAKQCPICYKWLARIRNTRHNTCFDDQNLHSYRMPCYRGSYFCLLCVEIYPNKEALATHYVKEHHPIDIKFVGYNVILIQRQTSENMNFGRDLVTAVNRQGWPSVGRDGQPAQQTLIASHLDSGSPFFSMLEDYVSKHTTFTLARQKFYEVMLLPNKIVYSYRIDAFKEFLFAGGGLDQTISNIHLLGKIPGQEYYGYERIERCTTYINIIKPLLGFGDRNRFRQFRMLREDEMMEDAEFRFHEILVEVEKLKDAGFYILEAQNYNHWFFDTLKQRFMFLAPHWITPSLKIANQLGFGTIQLTKTDAPIKLVGVNGLYISAVLAAYNYILIKQCKTVVNWDGNLDQYGRFPTFVVSVAERQISRSFGELGARQVMDPLRQMLKNPARTSAPAEHQLKKIAKLYSDRLKCKPIDLKMQKV